MTRDAQACDGQTIQVTHGDRVVFPDDGITKAEVVEHYARVAPFAMLPHLRGRPVEHAARPRQHLHAGLLPEGRARRTSPTGSSASPCPKSGGTVTHALCDDAASLVYLANQGCITPHVWLSRVPTLALPDRMIIDLDPGDGGVADARFAAHLARERAD